MKIFLDFDDTLFNTRAAIESMKDIFAEHGISNELFQNAYNEVKIGFDRGERTYDFDAHIGKLQQYCSFDEIALRNSIRMFVEGGEKFLFPDVIGFLSDIKKSGHVPYILSFGTSDFQTAKIAGTDLAGFMEKTIVTADDKEKALQKEIQSDEEAWFFDDRMKYIENVKRAFPKVRTVLVSRKEGRYHDEPNEYCDYVVKDFIEAERIFTLHS